MEGPLTHYQYDTFKTNPKLDWVEPAYVTFSIDANGKVDRVTMKPVSPAADFSWDYQDLLFTPVKADIERRLVNEEKFASLALAAAGLLLTSAAPVPASYSVLIHGGHDL